MEANVHLATIADKDMQSYFTSFDVPIWADYLAFNSINGIMAYTKPNSTKI